MTKFDNQISRMKAMMSYGLNENKNQFSDIEYQREGADGKMYGIVREGTKYYIKVSNKTTNTLKENFDYIGGFRNRKDNEYTSYANALKHFELKMQSIQEAKGKKDIVIESWNPDKKEMLTLEATDKMRREIARQQQIMGNATLIQEKKNYTVNLSEGECCKVDKECAATQKNNIKKKSDGKGEPTGTNGDPFTEKVKGETCQKSNGKNECNPVMESEQVLGWNDNADYLDTTHGTEVGDDAPFTEGEGTEKEMENGTVSEGVAMHKEGENQNNPTVGVGEVGDDAPFTETVKEGVEDFADDIEDNETFEDDEESFEDNVEEDDFDTEDDTEIFDDEEVAADDVEEDGIESRLSALEAMINKIADKLGVDAFEDDSLYDDENAVDDTEEFESEEEPMEEPIVDGDEIEMEDGFEDANDDEEEFDVYETVNYRKAMIKEENMDYFGKHPAYQKEPMKVPSAKHNEYQGYEDINDESVESEEAFGKEIGDSAPFEVDPKTITNAIAESIKKIFGKKKI